MFQPTAASRYNPYALWPGYSNVPAIWLSFWPLSTFPRNELLLHMEIHSENNIIFPTSISLFFPWPALQCAACLCSQLQTSWTTGGLR